MRPRPALDSATAYLQRLVTQLKSEGGTLLPGIEQCARLAGTSKSTMAMALRRLRDDGIVDPRPRRGTLLRSAGNAGTPAPVVAARPRPARAARLATAIRADVLRGAYSGEGMFPSVKELCGRYGACHATVRSALEALCSERVIEEHRKGFRVVHHDRASGGTVLLFVYADNLGNIIEMSPRTLGQVLLFEHVARSRGLQIETVACNYTGQRLVYDRSSMRGDRVDVLGSIVIRAGLNDQVLFPLLRRLQATDRPIALFDEVRTPAGDARLRNLPLVRTTVFTDDVQAGRDVGTFLLASGHRRVAYFSARHGDQWSVDRLQGIRAAFADAGLENGVETFTTHCPTLAGADLSSEQIRARITRPAAERMVRTFVDSWHIAFRETMVNRIAVDARACMLLELQADHLGRMFSNAVSDRSVTAWIGANDDAAVECILYLRAKGIAVPDTISVLGFDDSATALTYRLSSYSFNPVGAMHMMLEHITRPQSPLFRSHPAGACVPASGYVNQRMTTTNRT